MHFLKIKIYTNKFWVSWPALPNPKIKDKINFDFKLLISFNKHAKKKRILSLPSFIHLNKI